MRTRFQWVLEGKHISWISKDLSGTFRSFEVHFKSLLMLNVIPLCLMSREKGRRRDDRCPAKLSTV